VEAACGHRQVDLAIVSHAHPDHYRGVAGPSVNDNSLVVALCDRGRGVLPAAGIARVDVVKLPHHRSPTFVEHRRWSRLPSPAWR